MRKLHQGIAAVCMAFMLNGCSGTLTAVSNTDCPDPAQDLERIHEQGVIVVGVTDYAPMDFHENGIWSGFDAELSLLYAETLGVAVEFREIAWDSRSYLLDCGEIDLIWNGMSKQSETEKTMTCSVPYLSNAQTIVMKQSELSRYTSVESCTPLLFAVENGSSGQAILTEMDCRMVEFSTQQEALDAVVQEKTDAAVVDQIIAAGRIREDASLCSAYPLNQETICVGMRKDSSLEESVNAFLEKAGRDGTISRLAEKYGLHNAMLSAGANR